MVPASGETPITLRPVFARKDFQRTLIQKGDEFGGYVRFRFTEDRHEFKAVVEKCTAGTIVAVRPFLAKHHYTAEQLRF
jgi:hypothetical protein